MKRSLFRWVLPTLVLFVSGLSIAHGQIGDIVSQVSQSQYANYHIDVENSGLGLYGGSSYDQGYRGRNGNSGPGSLGNQEARLYLQDTFQAMGLDVSIQGTYRNVVGELPGVTNPDSIFIVGAHYDTTSGGDRPGGDDNASGTAGVVEAARVLSQYQFEATIRFIGFNAEEDGLLGSSDYVQNEVLANDENVVGMVNLDMILRPEWDSGGADIDLDLGTRTNYQASVAWAQEFATAAEQYAPSMVIDQTIFNVNGGSDQDPFVTAGIPAFLAVENTAQEIWGGSNEYYHTFHDASDRLANDPNGPSGVSYDFAFATDVTRITVALIAEHAVPIPVLLCPDSGRLLEGVGEIGDFNETCGSDDVYWGAHGAAFAFAINDPVTQFELRAKTTNLDPGTIELDIEAKKEAPTANLIVTAQLFNWTTGQYEIGSLPGTMLLMTTDSNTTFSLDGDASDYVGPPDENGNGEICVLFQTIHINGPANVRALIDNVVFDID